MAIYELDARFRIGPFKFGQKLGRKIDLAVGISVDKHRWSEGEGSQIVFDEKESQLKRIPVYWWDFSGHTASVLSPDIVAHGTWADTDAYGYVQTDLGRLVKEEINQHPVVGKKLRYVPD